MEGATCSWPLVSVFSLSWLKGIHIAYSSFVASTRTMDEDTSEILDGDVRFILETFVRERRMSFIAFKQVWKRINGPLLHRLLGNDSFDVRQDNYQRLYAHFLSKLTSKTRNLCGR